MRLPARFALVLLLGCNARFNFDESTDASIESAPMRPGPCASDAECGLPSLHCEAASGACVECTADEHCTQAALPRCDLSRLRCVQCLDGSDCPVGGACEPSTRSCRTTCTTVADCPTGSIECEFEEGRNVCEQCETRAECSATPATPICERHTERCVECVFDTDCHGAERHCDFVSATCVECADSSQCPAARPRCDPASHACVTGLQM